MIKRDIKHHKPVPTGGSADNIHIEFIDSKASVENWKLTTDAVYKFDIFFLVLFLFIFGLVPCVADCAFKSCCSVRDGKIIVDDDVTEDEMAQS